MHRRFSSLSLALSLAASSLLGPLGCASVDERSEAEFEEIATSPLGVEADAAWRDYVDGLELEALQDGCRPFRSELPPGVDYRGVAVLFHGFTACPQQYEETAAALAQQGIVSLVPLLPGHGRRPTFDAEGAARDDVSELPDDAGREAYAELAAVMNALASSAPGERTVIGLSVGGAVAARAAGEGTGFGRALLLNSFFEASGFVATLLAPANAVTPDKRIGWGEGCEKERARGRAGYCQFAFENLRAVQRFGQETAARAETIAIQVQNAGVVGDGAASPDAIAKVGDALSWGSTCFFPRGVNHSLLSRFDSPDEDKYWIPAVLEQASRFAAEGRSFDRAGSGGVAGYPLCRTR